MVAQRFGLRPEPVSTQVIPRDRHAAFTAAAGPARGLGIERLATEIRHLQRTEVGEAEEPFAVGQKGSSAMPHKRNPVLSENLTGLARMIRAAIDPGPGERGALARARHLAQLGRAGDAARCLHPDRLRAAPAGAPGRRAGGLPRADAAQSGRHPRPLQLAAGAAGPDRGRAAAPAGLRAGAARRRCAPGARAGRCWSCWPQDPEITGRLGDADGWRSCSTSTTTSSPRRPDLRAGVRRSDQPGLSDAPAGVGDRCCAGAAARRQPACCWKRSWPTSPIRWRSALEPESRAGAGGRLATICCELDRGEVVGRDGRSLIAASAARRRRAAVAHAGAVERRATGRRLRHHLPRADRRRADLR